MRIEFVYFDLGNVLVSFDPEIACRNVARLTGVSTEKAREVIYESGLQDSYEQGRVTSHLYWQLVCDQINIDKVDERKFSKRALLDAISDMFTPIDSMVETVAMARSRVDRVGVLSNTCPAHWQWVRKQPWPVSQIDYDVIILSCEVMSMKPEAKIYEAAEKAAAVRPDRILFLDDKMENVNAARERGWVAEQCIGGDHAKAVIERMLA